MSLVYKWTNTSFIFQLISSTYLISIGCVLGGREEAFVIFLGHSWIKTVDLAATLV